MLHFETVEPGTFSVLERLMRLKALQPFSLVGGTTLSLRYGHRTSVDLDLFYHGKFEPDPIAEALKKEFGKGYSAESKTARWGIFCYLDGIKVDIVHYPHPLISNIEETNNIRMYGDPDIIAMKLNAILGRGKKKDFWDLYELLHHHSLKDMIHFHEKKFPEQNLLITIPQAIIYFDDADESEDPISLKGQTWETVKKFIQQKVSDYLR
ncbi:MAG: nucleotidyl transferase AbiEii/AbiGii toxin family protein [Bacteroidia bacterium]|nr:nucleotidyl transferase AbiEii/AbiGii toxin family protein [Bacteroidia bacterium]